MSTNKKNIGINLNYNYKKNSHLSLPDLENTVVIPRFSLSA